MGLISKLPAVILSLLTNMHIVHNLMLLYGLFLICCGIAAVAFIGLKAKTALISGGTSGGVCIGIAYFSCYQYQAALVAGIIVSLALFIVFSWRCTKTLFAIFDLMANPGKELKGKGIAFLIIGLMAVVSLIVFGSQLMILFTGHSCNQ